MYFFFIAALGVVANGFWNNNRFYSWFLICVIALMLIQLLFGTKLTEYANKLMIEYT